MLQTLRPFALVAGAAYGVLGLFAAVYGIVRLSWPSVSIAEAILLGALVAAPVALALMWDRLTGFKLYGVEVSLAQASIRLDATLVDAAMLQYYSTNRELLRLISEALLEHREGPVEIPLQRTERPYWWSTRLFLVAALAQDYSGLGSIVFVEGGKERHFVGMVTPARLRMGIGRQYPVLEEVYGGLRAGIDHSQRPIDQVEQMIEQWSMSLFRQDGSPAIEADFKVHVDRSLLLEWMAKVGGIDDRYVRWAGFQDRALLSRIVGFDSPYVPLVEYGRLYKVVNRRAVVEEVAAKALR